MTDRLAGKVVLITGPARGIGAELARRLAARGARLALAGLEPTALAALAEALGPGHAWFECDVTDQGALNRAVEGSIRAFGGLDIVVANAGIATFGTVSVTPADALARVIEVNVTGVIRTVSATLPYVVGRRGYYLLVSSAAALAAMPGLAAYAASKSAVEQFGNALRLELAHKGVRVGTIHPCWIDTDLVRDTQRELQSFNELLRRLPGPFARVTSVDDCVAAMVAGIERRSRRIYVPGSIRRWAIVRQIFASRLAEKYFARDVREMMPKLETDVTALGRAFGQHSVELTRARRNQSL